MLNQLQQSVELQHVNVKLLLSNPEGIKFDRIVPVFHRWIQNRSADELLLDVADYTHIHHGPGVLLIGHDADYSIDNADGRLGVRYNHKAILNGSNVYRLKQALRAAIDACLRLEDDPLVADTVHFNGRDIEIFINDRLLAPNLAEIRSAAEPDIRAIADNLFEVDGYTLTFDPDPRRLLTASIHATRAYATSELLARL